MERVPQEQGDRQGTNLPSSFWLLRRARTRRSSIIVSDDAAPLSRPWLVGLRERHASSRRTTRRAVMGGGGRGRGRAAQSRGGGRDSCAWQLRLKPAEEEREEGGRWRTEEASSVRRRARTRSSLPSTPPPPNRDVVRWQKDRKFASPTMKRRSWFAACSAARSTRTRCFIVAARARTYDATAT